MIAEALSILDRGEELKQAFSFRIKQILPLSPSVGSTYGVGYGQVASVDNKPYMFDGLVAIISSSGCIQKMDPPQKATNIKLKLFGIYGTTCSSWWNVSYCSSCAATSSGMSMVAARRSN